jgi:heptosyltransferase-2
VTGLSFLGDALISLPALTALAAARPALRITIAAPEPGATVYRLSGLPGEVVSLPRTAPAILRAVRTLAATRVFSTALLLGGGFVWALAACLAGIPRRIGLASDGRSWLLSDAVRLDVETMHGSEAYLRYVERLLGKTLPPPGPSRLPCKAADQTGAADWLAAHLPGGKPFFSVHPGAGEPGKIWPADRFRTLAAGIHRECGLLPLIISGPAERETGGTLAAALADCGAGHAAGLPLGLLAAILARAAFHVGNNSGISHLAAAVGTRVACLSGPSNPLKTRPLGDGHLLLGRTEGRTRSARGRLDPALAALEPATVLAALRSAGWLG